MTAAADGFRMPAEWAPHERTWMAWPCPNPTFADAAELDEARAGLGRRGPRRPPLRAGHGGRRPRPAAYGRASSSARTSRWSSATLDDAWMRDIGPTFVTDGKGELAAVDWTFNGWGAQDWARWDHDSKIARARRRPRRSPPRTRRGSSTRAAASTSTARARSCSPRPSSSAPSATPAGPGSRSRRRSTPASAPPRRSGCRAASPATTRPRLRHPRPRRHRRRLRPRPASSSSTPSATPPTPTSRSASRSSRLLQGQTDARGRTLRIVEVPAPTVLKDDERLGRLLVHQPLPLQRRRRPVRLRRPARRDRGGHLPRSLPRPYGDARRRPYDLCRGWWHPLHHPAAAEGLSRSGTWPVSPRARRTHHRVRTY